jgi:hypothetical protein
MATFAPTSYAFVPPSYTYILTPLYFKSVAACGKPTSSILNKLYCSSKLSSLVLNSPRLLATAAANNNKGYRSRIQGIF